MTIVQGTISINDTQYSISLKGLGSGVIGHGKTKDEAIETTLEALRATIISNQLQKDFPEPLELSLQEPQ